MDIEDERFHFVTHTDGTVELIIPDVGPDDEHYNAGMQALLDIYNQDWWVVDQGSYGENGEYLLLKRSELE